MIPAVNVRRAIVFLVYISLLVNYVFSGCGCNVNRKKPQKSLAPSQRKLFLAAVISKNTCTNVNYQYKDMTFIPGGSYQIGTDKKYFIADKEAFIRNVTLKAFYIDKYEVTNRDFNEFIKDTNYITEAENFGDSFVFKAFLSAEVQEKYEDFRVIGSPWWFKIPLTTWFNPEGPGSNITSPDRWDHPVVHVSWNDAVAYCSWRHGRLPTEWEWEVACKGKLRNKIYPWGNKLVPQGKHRMNIWQGKFPDYNSKEDGWLGTNPVGTYPPNGYDLYDITGNVWEWTSDHWNPNRLSLNERVKKGGSYLCHASYCSRYRCSARSQNTADSTAGNLGFRCCANP